MTHNTQHSRREFTSVLTFRDVRPATYAQVCLFVTSHRQDPGGTGVRLTEPVHLAVCEIEAGCLVAASL